MISLHIKRKYGIRCFTKRCRCGRTFYIPFLLFFLKNRIYRRCSECGEVYCFVMIHHIVSDSLDSKCIDEKKISFSDKIWRYG